MSDEEPERQYTGKIRQLGSRMDGRTWAFHIVMLAATVAVFFLGIYYSAIGDVIVSLLVIAVMVPTMFLNKRIVHIPPAMIVVTVGIMYLAIAGKVFVDNSAIEIVCDTLVGAVLGMCGIIAVYTVTKSLPGARDENPAVVSLFAFASSASVLYIWHMIEYYLVNLGPAPLGGESTEMLSGLCALVGAAVISVLYYENKHSGFFQHTVNLFLETNSDTLKLTDSDASGISRLISAGESDGLEFKSTLRTNLKTGERDKRMEKAVLKTLVAFLNTDGGTLLVGVTDDGGIRGVDDEDFENRDKLNLHITNLVASQIGNEFLPFISFRLVDIKEKCIIVFDCRRCEKPVFLKEGAVETFFVRSGPSSVELTGMNLINYVNNRKMF